MCVRIELDIALLDKVLDHAFYWPFNKTSAENDAVG